MRAPHPAHDVGTLGTILGVWAHPDDETFIAAGIMAAAAQNGQKVVCVTFTHGEAGVYDPKKWPPETLGEVRKHELEQALRELGVDRHYLFDFPDGGCADADRPEALRRLHHIVDAYKPDTILTFGPDGLTGHPDHQVVSSWVDACVQHMPQSPRVLHAAVNPRAWQAGLQAVDSQTNMFFNIDKPPLVPEDQCAFAFVLTPELLDKKCRALAVMPSQTERLFAVATPEQIRGAFETEFFVEASFTRK